MSNTLRLSARSESCAQSENILRRARVLKFMIKQLSKKILPHRLWVRLRLMRLHRLVEQYQPREVRHTYGGLPLNIYLADPLAQGWYDQDWPELSEIAFLRRHRLQPGARVFDLGAHQCVVALMLADAVGPGGSVIALEANSHNAAVGKRNQELNQAEHLTVLHAAVAEESGELLLNESLNGQVDDGSNSYGQVKVPAFSVDDLAQKYGVPDVLFIDVEGYECHALRGAAETLRARPDCFVEVHVGEGLEKFGGSVASVTGFFPTDTYDLWMASDAHRDFVPFAPDSRMTAERFFLIATAKH